MYRSGLYLYTWKVMPKETLQICKETLQICKETLQICTETLQICKESYCQNRPDTNKKRPARRLTLVKRDLHVQWLPKPVYVRPNVKSDLQCMKRHHMFQNNPTYGLASVKRDLHVKKLPKPVYVRPNVKKDTLYVQKTSHVSRETYMYSGCQKLCTRGQTSKKTYSM